MLVVVGAAAALGGLIDGGGCVVGESDGSGGCSCGVTSTVYTAISDFRDPLQLNHGPPLCHAFCISDGTP